MPVRVGGCQETVALAPARLTRRAFTTPGFTGVATCRDAAVPARAR